VILVARKPRTRAGKRINKDKGAEFLAIKKDLNGNVVWEETSFGTATMTGTGTTTITTDRDLLAALVQMTVTGTSCTGTAYLNGDTLGTFSGGLDTVAMVADTVQTPINSITIAVTTTAALTTANFSAFAESRWF